MESSKWPRSPSDAALKSFFGTSNDFPSAMSKPTRGSAVTNLNLLRHNNSTQSVENVQDVSNGDTEPGSVPVIKPTHVSDHFTSRHVRLNAHATSNNQSTKPGSHADQTKNLPRVRRQLWPEDARMPHQNHAEHQSRNGARDKNHSSTEAPSQALPVPKRPSTSNYFIDALCRTLPGTGALNLNFGRRQIVPVAPPLSSIKPTCRISNDAQTRHPTTSIKKRRLRCRPTRPKRKISQPLADDTKLKTKDKKSVSNLSSQNPSDEPEDATRLYPDNSGPLANCSAPGQGSGNVRQLSGRSTAGSKPANKKKQKKARAITKKTTAPANYPAVRRKGASKTKSNAAVKPSNPERVKGKKAGSIPQGPKKGKTHDAVVQGTLPVHRSVTGVVLNAALNCPVRRARLTAFKDWHLSLQVGLDELTADIGTERIILDPDIPDLSSCWDQTFIQREAVRGNFRPSIGSVIVSHGIDFVLSPNTDLVSMAVQTANGQGPVKLSFGFQARDSTNLLTDKSNNNHRVLQHAVQPLLARGHGQNMTVPFLRRSGHTGAHSTSEKEVGNISQAPVDLLKLMQTTQTPPSINNTQALPSATLLPPFSGAVNSNAVAVPVAENILHPQSNNKQSAMLAGAEHEQMVKPGRDNIESADVVMAAPTEHCQKHPTRGRRDDDQLHSGNQLAFDQKMGNIWTGELESDNLLDPVGAVDATPLSGLAPGLLDASEAVENHEAWFSSPRESVSTAISSSGTGLFSSSDADPFDDFFSFPGGGMQE